MDFETRGQWGWYTTNAAHGLADQWQNPGGGFGYCPSWCALDTIVPDSVSFQSALEAGRARGH
jgi:hypothetical protein